MILCGIVFFGSINFDALFGAEKSKEKRENFENFESLALYYLESQKIDTHPMNCFLSNCKEEQHK